VIAGLEFCDAGADRGHHAGRQLAGMNGSAGLNWYLPLIITRSTKLTETASVSSSTSPGFGSGFGVSPSAAFSMPPNSLTTTARIKISYSLSMIFSENRFPLFGIML
jgi:hypothetical protein